MNEEKTKKGGPRTPEGKAKCSGNSLKHGLTANQILIPGEDPEVLEALIDNLERDHNPETATEVLLVHNLAKFHWLMNRAIRLQQKAFENPDKIDSKFLELMMRYQGANQRAFAITLKSLEAAKKEREKQGKESVSPEGIKVIFPGSDKWDYDRPDEPEQEEEIEEECRIFLRPPGKLA